MAYLGPNIKMKSKGILIVSYFEKDSEDKLQKIDQKEIKCTKKELIESLKDTKIEIEYVTEKPSRWRFGVIYVLETPKGRPTYLFTNQING